MGVTSPLPVVMAKVIDQTRCIGCHACSTACKSENEVPVGVHRTYVKSVDVGLFPQARRAFQVTRCNQCASAPCVAACPTSAMYAREDGIVDFDKSVCIGCKACVAACPYDAIFINPEDHSAEKCNFCAHRLEVGLEPACVVVCPTEAILVGDLNDPSSRAARRVGRSAVSVRRPEKETRPKLFYEGAHQATLDPLAARRPDGGLFMWSEQGEGVASGHPSLGNSAAAALLSYDVPHGAPWGVRVSLYTFTKGIAAGAYLIWWTDAGVHQNLTFPVQPDPVSGMHCWHQAVRVTRAEPGDRHGDVFVDTGTSRRVYLEWLEKTRPAERVSPDGTRRPYWLLRPLKPAREAWRLPKRV